MSEELVRRIGALRVSAEIDSPEPRAPAREQLDVVDGAIRVAANLAGKSDIERRAALREVQPGVTITAEGASKTRLSRDEKLAKVQAWAEGLTEDQRETFIVSEKFEALTDRQQKRISEAFEAIDGTSDAGDEMDWNLQALDQDAPYITTIDDEENEPEQEFAPLPWERRDVNGNLYLDEGEDV